MPDLILRKACTIEDSYFLFYLRNDPLVVANSGKRRKVEIDEHNDYFLDAISNPYRYLFIAEVGGVPVGQGRIDVDGACAELSVAVIEAERNKSYGFQIVWRLQQIANGMGYSSWARIRPDNYPSIKCFERNGVLFELIDG